jgi:hypothetical protein
MGNRRRSEYGLSPAAPPGAPSEGAAMNATATPRIARAAAGFELRFQSLFNEGRALSFPCDGVGHVDLDALSDRARSNYFYARTVIGREYAHPAVQRALH